MNKDEWMELGKRPERLHPDLEKYLITDRDGVRLNHPLVQFLRFDPDDVGLLNRSYQKKCKDLAHAFDQEDWYTFIILHERPYRLDAFMQIAHEMPYRKFWALLSMVWMDAHILWRNEAIWRELWNEDRPCKQYAMNATERKAFKRLPDEITVYRGIGDGNTINGMSWTLDRDKAIWFARSNAEPPVLLTGRAMKSDAHALLLGRKEKEIVLERCEVIATERLAQS